MSEALKPCPFCGGEAVFFITRLRDMKLIAVCCKKCEAETKSYAEESLAVEAWNNRPNPWHTGTPTEDGLYWVAVRFSFSNDIMKPFAETIRYGATPFNNGSWNLELPYVVVAWQKIELYTPEQVTSKLNPVD